MRVAGLFTGLLTGLFCCEDWTTFRGCVVGLFGVFFGLFWVFGLGWVEVDAAAIMVSLV